MASEGEGADSSSAAATGKMSIKDELALLSKSGQVGANKNKFRLDAGSTSFMTPEQAKAFLAEQKNASKKGTVQPTPPSDLSSGELDSWYSQQKAKQAEARRKREEAEAILRGYRGAWDGSKGGGGGGSSGSLPPSGPDAGPDVSDARGMFQTMERQGSAGNLGKKWRKQGNNSEEEKKSEIDYVKRKEAEWKLISNDPGSKYAPEPDRYHLYVSLACPWSHRVLIVRALKGLEDVVSMTVVYPIWQRTRPDDPSDPHTGWVFANPESEAPVTNADGVGGPFPSVFHRNEPDPIFGCKSVRDLYEQAGESDGKDTVPMLWDKKTGTIVSRESLQIMKMLNGCFNEFSKNAALDLYPVAERNKIDETGDLIYPLSNGVYRVGFATTQKDYDESLDALEAVFDKVESILSNQRYICGGHVTEADARLFVTLIRYDEIYSVYFKCTTRSVMASPILLDYCRDIYQTGDIRETVDMEQAQAHYYCSHPELNKYSIIPRSKGFIKKLEQPHDRAGLSASS
eukprot:CAMPEP_0181043656 /NCGR_PEP_ID=MMETSP1070-20121207/12835_1 /TAXON_ID=265543 /ORGANISM="Minutocellus polymorphus, Strain NH13" /LENGTH=514 /DNA_ID=CAMNT_0023122021 /DNA_START=10 /DNA_END=1554 /DNA_ORIENTATION=+